MKKATIVFIIILSINSETKSQCLQSLLKSNDTIAVTHNKFGFLEESPKDGMTILRTMFYIYKNFVSSQDAQKCMFSPSCSEYAFLSMKKNGIVLGLIDFWDRFSRCNPLSHENYEVDIENKQFLDPVL
ncbi:MAG: membrane protein insertion efficiency factor YidD [Bacteroidia bacterium]|nr:membrane protein insertion efficiency factor YidD [Bacteroidia bacterium]